ncbi:Las1-domain-containing protein [Lophiostoma macrostomum CBS 122681]|uniref:Las1-domain-containing protein n=1 Tax=Lophiostoma macrostomum CBS 122681 TaxID=1314788 RepID=A0A6A6TI34_9PLEO|nr:Las1-domain-containing protein [Lophiostoma macrostomum CBS 122681]
METRFVVTPWRDPEELLQVRQDLYGSSAANSIERRQKAVHKILTWRIRQPELPLLLDSTADIVDAVLQDERCGLGHNAMRLVYATAISRFITGFTDTKSDLLSSRPPWSLKPPNPETPLLSLPPNLLETRHAIVHRHLPPLSELRNAARQSLDWLWEWYWSQLDRAFALPGTGLAGEKGTREDEGEKAEEALKDSLKEILKAHVKRRKDEIKDGLKTTAQLARYKAQVQIEDADAEHVSHGTGTSTDISTAAILSHTHTHTRTHSTASVTNALAELLIHDRLVLPSKLKRGDSMAGAFMIWDPLLVDLQLSTSFSLSRPSPSPGSPLLPFLRQLLDSMIDRLNTRSAPGPAPIRVHLGDDEPVKEALHAWLLHMLTSPAFAHGRREQGLVEAVLERCFTEPTAVNLRIAGDVLEGQGEVRDKGLWVQVLKGARGDGLDVDEAVAEAKAKGRKDGRVDMVEEQAEDSVKRKWSGPRRKLGLWRPTPIGVVPVGWEDTLR